MKSQPSSMSVQHVSNTVYFTTADVNVILRKQTFRRYFDYAPNSHENHFTSHLFKPLAEGEDHLQNKLEVPFLLFLFSSVPRRETAGR